jgi:hypothetical protein
MKQWLNRQPQKGIIIFILVLCLPGMIPCILIYEAAKRWWLRRRGIELPDISTV